MTINIVSTAKHLDGLFFYSYEYYCKLREEDIDVNFIVRVSPHTKKENYIKSIQQKYKVDYTDDIIFDNFTPSTDDVTFILGRSMMTLPIRRCSGPDPTLDKLFKCRVLAVYSESIHWEAAVRHYKPKEVISLCDYDVYPNGEGLHFKKGINFSIYKDVRDDIKYRYMLLGTNDRYYNVSSKISEKYIDSAIAVYKHQDNINKSLTHLFCPTDNFLGLFEKYVYTKDCFDPAPRLVQECHWLGKEIIYDRDLEVKDGGSDYYERGVVEHNINPILEALNVYCA